jgi:hypothetical protein
LSDENGPDDTSRPLDEEEQVEDTRRVRPLFRFGRRGSRHDDAPNGGEEPAPPGTEEEEEAGSPQTPVRPVRVVKFIPFGAREQEGEPEGDVPPFAGTEEVPEGEAPFTVEEEPPFAWAEPSEEEAPFAVEEEAPFAVEQGTAFTEVDSAPPAPLETIEDIRWDEPVHDSVSVQEEAETGEEFRFRQEETPATFETSEQRTHGMAPPAEPVDESKPHYHKFLKPDEEMLQRKQATGPATGFDRDMDADAGEIDFGIDLIDPSERKKQRKTPPRKDEAGPKKGVGGHDSDGEVVSTQSGVDIGVDYQKRRKRRL